MPLYEYECDACGQRFELIQKYSDGPPEACPKCAKGPVQRLQSSPAFHLKGSGWYITDYARKGTSPEGESAKGESSKGEGSKKADASASSSSGSDGAGDSKKTDTDSGRSSANDGKAASPPAASPKASSAD